MPLNLLSSRDRGNRRRRHKRRLDFDCRSLCIMTGLVVYAVVYCIMTFNAAWSMHQTPKNNKELLERLLPRSKTTQSNQKALNAEEDLIQQMIDWARDNGAYISDKVQVQSIGEGLSGIFATEPLPKGHVVSSVPYNIFVKPERDDGWCAAVWAVHEAITKDPIDQTPYEKYLATKSRNFMPAFWSYAGKNALKELIGEDLPTLHFDTTVERTFIDECEVDPQEIKADGRILDAVMLAMTRAEGPEMEHFVPFHDLINHRNGKWTNTEIKVTGEGSKRRYALVVTRNVHAGEEMLSSYNQCPWCQLYSNPESEDEFFVTPQMYEQYGFVELYPQRWVILQVRLLFDIDHQNDTDDYKDGGEEEPLEVRFPVPPSTRALEFLQDELVRLAAFQHKYKNNHIVPEHELRSIWEYHKAIVTAFTLAHKSALGQVSEDIWNLGSTWYQEEEEEDAD